MLELQNAEHVTQRRCPQQRVQPPSPNSASCQLRQLPSAIADSATMHDARIWENEFPSAASGMSQLQQCDASAHPHPTRTGAAHDVLGPGVLEASPQSAAKAATLDTSQLH
jgi:hypothetical protein